MDLRAALGGPVADPITPIDPRPFVGQTLTLPDDATVVELDPQPFNNTKEIIILNLSTTDQVLVQVADLSEIPASATVEVDSLNNELSGETLSFDAVTLTAVTGPQTSGSDDFSVPQRCRGVVSVNVPALTVGDRIALFPPGGAAELDAWGLENGKGPNYSEQFVLTGVASPRVAGSLTFEVDAGSELLIAASITAALGDSPFAPGLLDGLPGGLIDLGAPPWGATFNGAKQGNFIPNGSEAPPVNINNWSLVVSTATPGDLTASWAGGPGPAGSRPGINLVVAPGSAFSSLLLIAPSREVIDLINSEGAVAWNIALAINDALNTTAAFVTARMDEPLTASTNASGKLTVFAAAAGTAGNGIVVASTDPAIITTSPTSGGKDALPSAASVVAATSTVIPAGGAITLAIGSEGNRQALADSTYWAANPGSKLGIILKAASGTDVDVNVTLVQNRGYPEGV